MSLAEEYKSLFSPTEKDKGSSLKLVLNPHCGCLGNAPGCHGAWFHGGWWSHTGALHFNWAVSIHDTISKRIITHHTIEAWDNISFKTWLSLQFMLGAGTLCALGQEIIQDVSGLPNLTGWHIHPVHRLNMKFTTKIGVYYFMIAQMSLILLQLDFGLNGVLKYWENTKIWPNCVRLQPYAYGQHINVIKHFLYV
jgi:hypothetical protein